MKAEERAHGPCRVGVLEVGGHPAKLSFSDPHFLFPVVIWVGVGVLADFNLEDLTANACKGEMECSMFEGKQGHSAQ